MAPALTSDSFRLKLAAYPKRSSRPPKPAALVYAKKKKESEAQAEDSAKTNRFSFDFLKIPDAKSLVPVVTAPSTSLFATRRKKDPRTVFVAGATGQAGVRIAQTLLRQGFAVRAGVPELAAAQELARIAAEYKIISPEESKRLNAVESTFGDAESIAKAIGPAAKVVVTIGAAENGPASRVTTDDALNVVRAAQLAGVGHVAVVYDSGTGSVDSTYNVLDGITSFFFNLFSRSQPLTVAEFLSKVAETDVSYTLIKAALTDDYYAKSSYALVVSKEGTAAANAAAATESNVSKSQIATLVADVFSNTSVTENKVVVVSTSPSASQKPIIELFSAIPEDGRRKAYAEAQAKARAAEEALLASEKAREADKAAKKLEVEVKKLSGKKSRAVNLSEEVQERAGAAGSSIDSLLSKAKNFSGELSWENLSSQISTAVAQKPDDEPRTQVGSSLKRAEAAGSSIDNLLSKAKNFSGEFSWENLSSQISTAVAQKPDDEPRTQVATARGQAKARNLRPQKAVIKQLGSKPKPKQPEPKVEVNSVFGGLFKQETIYIDDD